MSKDKWTAEEIYHIVTDGSFTSTVYVYLLCTNRELSI